MTETASRQDDPLQAAYREEDRLLRIRSILVADIVALICMPAGISLDYFVYPEKVWQFLGLRLLVDAVLLVIIVTLFVAKNRCSLGMAKALGVTSTLVVNLSFCAMIYLTQGTESPYYAGLNLVILIMATLLPWTAWETALVCGLSLISYLAACFLNPQFSPEASISSLFNNSYFIGITAVICVTSSYFRSRARFDDFRLRHQLDVQNRELQDLDRLKTQFFSNVSHELRTPLTLILGPVENTLSRSRNLDADVTDALLLIQRNSLRLLKLINDLLDLTKLDEGGEVLRREQTPVDSFVRGVVDSVRHLGLSKQLRLQVEEGNAQDQMYVDPIKIEKVLINLLTNAIKYTPAGGQITIAHSSDAASTTIVVTDTGVGIPQTDLAQIFNRFHQVRSNAANQSQGVGIGLALVKELVEAHGGQVLVESVVGSGSTFRLVLPSTPVPREASLIPEVSAVVPMVEEPFEKAFRSADRAWRSVTPEDATDLPMLGRGQEVILVADDENDMRNYIVSLLSTDYRVVQTGKGANVATLVAEHEPAFVLLDWMMPDVEGIEVCRELRANPRNQHLKIVLLTARIDEASKLRALEAGADDFLTKPFSSVELRTRAANLVKTAVLQRNLSAHNEELSQALDQLRRTEAQLIQSEKMNAIGSLSAGLLHEINNPLNYTLTAIKLAGRRSASLSPDMQEIIQDVEEGMVRIRDVVTDLRTFAYPAKADSISTFSLAEAVRMALKLLTRDTEGIDVTLDIPPDLQVSAQKTQLTHLFINLLANATKAIQDRKGPGPSKIRVKAKVEAEPGSVAITIEDSGPGVPEELLGRVFEPFFTTRDPGAGMGLGLSICHTITKAHGGEISVENLPTGGAKFTVVLPIVSNTPSLC